MLGSADFLGSPISFVRTLETGVKDFFIEPTKGLAEMHPVYSFGVGLARGTQSLVKNSTIGAFNSVGKFTNTIGKGFAELTFDKNYVRERELLSREKPKHIFEGIAYGLRDFGLGCFHGFGGVLVRIPLPFLLLLYHYCPSLLSPFLSHPSPIPLFSYLPFASISISYLFPFPFASLLTSHFSPFPPYSPSPPILPFLSFLTKKDFSVYFLQLPNTSVPFLLSSNIKSQA